MREGCRIGSVYLETSIEMTGASDTWTPFLRDAALQSSFPGFNIYRERYVKCRGYGLGGTGIPRATHRAI